MNDFGEEKLKIGDYAWCYIYNEDEAIYSLFRCLIVGVYSGVPPSEYSIKCKISSLSYKCEIVGDAFDLKEVHAKNVHKTIDSAAAAIDKTFLVKIY